MKQYGAIDRLHARALGRVLSAIVTRRQLMLAVFFMAVSFFSFLKLLQIADLSFAVPATALTYLGNAVVARTVLKERVDASRWAGVALVACGVAVLAL
jgi:drug/metabolite transporter (DMT)-like permease